MSSSGEIKQLQTKHYTHLFQLLYL